MLQFIYKSDDLVETDLTRFDQATLIMMLIAIEASNPGTLAHVVRAAALASDGWRTTSTASDPERSRKSQRELHSWLDDFQSALEEQEQKGEEHDKE